MSLNLSDSQTLSECFQLPETSSSVAYIIDTVNQNFDEGQVTCESLNSNLASILTEEEFDFIFEFIQETTQNNSNYIFGLKRLANTGLNDPLQYFFIDGEENQTFYENFNEFPWGFNRPNLDDESIESCGDWGFTEDRNVNVRFKWNDRECTQNKAIICKTSTSFCEPKERINNLFEFDVFTIGFLSLIALTLVLLSVMITKLRNIKKIDAQILML